MNCEPSLISAVMPAFSFHAHYLTLALSHSLSFLASMTEQSCNVSAFPSHLCLTLSAVHIPHLHSVSCINFGRYFRLRYLFLILNYFELFWCLNRFSDINKWMRAGAVFYFVGFTVIFRDKCLLSNNIMSCFP